MSSSQEKYTVNVAMAQMDIDAGHPRKNAKKAIEIIDKCRDLGVDIVAFPEMVSGYMVSDMLEDPAYVKECRQEEHANLIYGICSFCEKRGMKRIVIGLSGGVDSALVACLCVEAMGAENVLAVNMPTKFNDPSTKNAARYVAEQLGIEYVTVPIEDLTNDVREIIKDVVWNGDFGVYSEEALQLDVDQKTADDARLVDENLQAKIRGSVVLSGIASKFQAVFTNNGNKSEALQGFLTIDGDGRGFLQIIGDEYKQQVIDLSVDYNLRAIEQGQPPVIPWELLKQLFDGERYYDDWDGQQTPIPEGIQEIVASAELSAAQAVAEGKGDPIHFLYHDNMFRKWAEDRANVEDLARVLCNEGVGGLKEFLGLTKLAVERTFGTYLKTPADFIDDLERRWRNYHQSTIFKQIQSPPVIVTSQRPEGYDHRRSQTSADFSQAYGRFKQQILQHNDWAYWS